MEDQRKLKIELRHVAVKSASVINENNNIKNNNYCSTLTCQVITGTLNLNR